MRKLVTEGDLSRARSDPKFRQKFLAHNLDMLLEALKKARRSSPNRETASQIREGVDLAVQLADRLQSVAEHPMPPDADEKSR